MTNDQQSFRPYGMNLLLAMPVLETLHCVQGDKCHLGAGAIHLGAKRKYNNPETECRQYNSSLSIAIANRLS